MKNRRDIENSLKTIIIEIKDQKEVVNKIKEGMLNHGILSGNIRKIMLNPNEISNFSFSTLCLFTHEVYEATFKNEINPSVFGLYNSKVKAKFLNNYKSNTQGSYLRIFENSARTETLLKKDLFEFTLEEIESVLYDLEPLTNSASHVNGRIITAYVEWAKGNRFTNNTNRLKDLPMAWFNQFVDNDIQLYFSEEELRKIEDECVNYQDAVILRLLFEGVEGKAVSELRNLKAKDVDFDNAELYLQDEEGNSRFLSVGERALYLIQGAINQSEYVKKNGYMEENENMGLTTNLVKNEYVLRSSITKTESYNYAIEKMAIYRRIKIISETLGLPHLTSKNVVRSGIIHMAKNLMDERKKLDREEYLEIADKYMINNWYPIKKFCNKTMIEKIYKNEVAN